MLSDHGGANWPADRMKVRRLPNAAGDAPAVGPDAMHPSASSLEPRERRTHRGPEASPTLGISGGLAIVDGLELATALATEPDPRDAIDR
jgi:hypothetical protein